MKNSRPIIFTLAIAALLGVSCSPKEKEETQVGSTGESLFETVKHFVSLGEHRTATPGDTATSAWLKSELDAVGAQTQFVEYPLTQFFFEEGHLSYDSQKVEVFPVWPIKEKLQLSISGIVVDGSGLKDLALVKGKIVLTHLKHQHGASTPTLAAAIDTFIQAGAIGVVAIPDNSTQEIVALNTFDGQKAWDAPVYELAPKDSALILQAIAEKKPIKIEVKGALKQVTARNIVAKIGTGKQYVVISTPISGWFRTGGERGPGIAIWLGLAKWVKANEEKFKEYTFVFTGNSGHELSYIGARVFVDKAAPKPEETKLWIHLGAAVAVKEWKEQNGQWILSDSVDGKRNIYYSSSLAQSFEKSFGNIKAEKVKGTSENAATVRPGGEGIIYQKHGYNNLVSIAYSHRLHHVKTDDENSTSSVVLLELKNALQDFITTHLTAK